MLSLLRKNKPAINRQSVFCYAKKQGYHSNNQYVGINLIKAKKIFVKSKGYVF